MFPISLVGRDRPILPAEAARERGGIGDSCLSFRSIFRGTKSGEIIGFLLTRFFSFSPLLLCFWEIGPDWKITCCVRCMYLLQYTIPFGQLQVCFGGLLLEWKERLISCGK